MWYLTIPPKAVIRGMTKASGGGVLEYGLVDLLREFVWSQAYWQQANLEVRQMFGALVAKLDPSDRPAPEEGEVVELTDKEKEALEQRVFAVRFDVSSVAISVAPLQDSVLTCSRVDPRATVEENVEPPNGREEIRA